MADVMYTVMDSPICLPCWTVPSALTGAAQLPTLVSFLVVVILANYAPMIYTAPCVMFLKRADPFRDQVGGGWALEIESFLGPVT
jgi:hypothetical protein